MKGDQYGIGPALDAMLAIALEDLNQLLPDEDDAVAPESHSDD